MKCSARILSLILIFTCTVTFVTPTYVFADDDHEMTATEYFADIDDLPDEDPIQEPFSGDGDTLEAEKEMAAEIDQIGVIGEPKDTMEEDDYAFGERYIDEDLTDQIILSEDEDKREETTKHFFLSDGTMAAAAYGFPIHELDENGDWIDIDNSFITDTNEAGEEIYIRKSLHDAVTFYVTTKGHGNFEVQNPDGSFSWGIITGSGDSIMSLNNPEETEDDRTSQYPDDESYETTIDEVSISEENDGSIEATDDETMDEDSQRDPKNETEMTDESQELSDEETLTNEASDKDENEDYDAVEATEEQADSEEIDNESVKDETDTDESEAPDIDSFHLDEEGTDEDDGLTEILSAPIFSATYEADDLLKEIDHTDMDKLVTNSVSGLITYTYNPDDMWSPDVVEKNNPHIELKYRLIGHDIKEELVLLDKNALQENSGSFFFNLTLENYIPIQVDDQTIGIQNTEGEIQYTLSAPYMCDDAGAVSGDLTFKLELQLSENSWRIQLTPDENWIQSEGRLYPITIDPTIAWQYGGYGSLENVYVASANPNTTYYNYGEILLGRASSTYGENLRGVFKFQQMPTLTEADMVIGATVSFVVKNYSEYSSSHSGNIVMNLHEMTQSVALNSLTWNTLQGKYSSTVVDSQYVTPSEVSGAHPRITWDITKTVKDWYLTGKNYGLAIITENETSSTIRCLNLYSATGSSTATSNLPVFAVTYLNQEGLESYQTTHSAGTDTMGTLHVGDFNGNLVYTYNDISMTGTGLPVSIIHIYNHSKRSTAAVVGSGMYYGNGMQLNLSMKVETCSVTGYPYKLMDADGTIHYFKLKSGTSGQSGSVYEKEFETTTLLTKTSSGYTLTDTSTTKYTFNSSGYLAKIEDTSTGQSQTLSYTSGRLTSVKDSANRTTTLVYNSSGYLSSITDPAGRATTYTYSNNNLTKITKPDGTAISLAYTSSGGKYQLTQVTDIDNAYIAISYYTNAPYRVKQMVEYGTGGEEGNKLTWTYTAGETIVKDRQNRSETMMFDNCGHTITIRDGGGNAVYGSYAESNNNRKHALLYSSKMQGTVTNYYRNSGFESSTYSPWGCYNKCDTVTTVPTTEQVYEGKQSLKITNSLVNSKGYGIYQIADISGVVGQLVTISGYVKFLNYNPSGNNGFRLNIRYKDASGSWVNNYGPVIQNLQEWNHVSWTIQIPSTASSESIQGCYLIYNLAGSLYLDNAQMEVGGVSNHYNLVNNPYFRDTTGTATPAYWSAINLGSNDKVTAGRTGNGYAITGEATKHKGLYQSIKIKNGKSGDQYIFGAWAKASAIARSSKYHTSQSRYFSVRIRFIKSDDTYEDKYYHFEAKSPNWQYLSGSVVAPFDYDRLNIALLYSYQKNTAVFDEVQMFREGFGDQLSYDSEGRVTKRVSPGGYSTTYTYVASGRSDLSEITYSDGTKVTYTYNSSRQLTAATDTSGKTVNYTYDANGNLTKSSIAVGSTTLASGTKSYSGAYLGTDTDAYGNSIAYTYNALKGITTSITDKRGTVTNYSYNANNDYLTKVTTGSSTVSYSYTNGRLTGVTHNATSSASVSYSMTYNVYGVQTGVKVGSQSLITFTYASKNGDLTKTTYGNGNTAVPTYDSLGRVIAMSYNGTATYRYYYGVDGKVGYEQDLVNNLNWRYEYDQSGRLTAISSSAGEQHSYTYDATTGRITQDDYNSAGSTKRVDTKYSYTKYNSNGERLLSQIAYRWGTIKVKYTYDDFYRATKTVTLESGANEKTSYTYRSGSASGTTTLMPETITNTVKNSAGTTKSTKKLSYTYDANGNILTIKEGNTQKVKYTYDSLNQLTREDNAWLNKSYVYAYDQGGNITSKKEYAYTTGTLGSATATKSYTYGDSNWKDKLTKYNGTTISYDAIGNPTTYYNGWNFTWQKGRQMKSATKGSDDITFGYNSSGEQIFKP